MGNILFMREIYKLTFALNYKNLTIQVKCHGDADEKLKTPQHYDYAFRPIIEQIYAVAR